jgi:septal ring factor EnvC (AmiA/AmiB activator)
VAGLLVGSLAAAQDRRQSEAQLSAVRKEIKELQERIARETARRDEGARALRASEVEIAAATRTLAEVSANLSSQEKARRDLERETASANRRLDQERDALARQVRSSYMAGREELTKLLLSQESPAALGRMLVYFDYYNRARSARIAAVAQEVAKLAELDAASARGEAEQRPYQRADHVVRQHPRGVPVGLRPILPVPPEVVEPVAGVRGAGRLPQADRCYPRPRGRCVWPR